MTGGAFVFLGLNPGSSSGRRTATMGGRSAGWQGCRQQGSNHGDLSYRNLFDAFANRSSSAACAGDATLRIAGSSFLASYAA